MQRADLSNAIRSAHHDADDSITAIKLIKSLRESEDLLFQGRDQIQPIKLYQVQRIYRLAKAFIEVIKVIYPYLRTIISLLKK
jgi:hypothetical protein